MSNGGIAFEIFLQGEMAMRVVIDQRLQRQDISDCLKTLEMALQTAEKESFQDYGVFNWEIDGREVQVVHTE